MMQAFDVQLLEGRRLFQLVGWFSLCLIVAGWGPSIQPAIRSAWACAGIAGISAALLLDLRFRREHSADSN